jgi:hypothetical protein
MRGPAWIAHAAATKLCQRQIRDSFLPVPHCRFLFAVSQHLAHGLVPEVLSDEIPFNSFRRRVSYRTSACVRDCFTSHRCDVD